MCYMAFMVTHVMVRKTGSKHSFGRADSIIYQLKAQYGCCEYFLVVLLGSVRNGEMNISRLYVGVAAFTAGV